MISTGAIKDGYHNTPLHLAAKDAHALTMGLPAVTGALFETRNLYSDAGDDERTPTNRRC